LGDEQRSEVETATFNAIETIVHQGKAVVSSEDSAIIDWALRTTGEGRTATLYLKPIVYEAIRRRYWTPERVDIAKLKPISGEQAARVKSDFNIEIDGNANSLICPRCGHVYSTYEFIQQGFEQHGEEVVRATFSVKRVAILQINPVQNIICRNCRLHMVIGGEGFYPGYDYEYYGTNQAAYYACCRAPYPIPPGWPVIEEQLE
jgi:hypothetical protein